MHTVHSTTTLLHSSVVAHSRTDCVWLYFSLRRHYTWFCLEWQFVLCLGFFRNSNFLRWKLGDEIFWRAAVSFRKKKLEPNNILYSLCIHTGKHKYIYKYIFFDFLFQSINIKSDLSAISEICNIFYGITFYSLKCQLLTNIGWT